MRNFEPLDIEKGEHISALKKLVSELKTKFGTTLIIKEDSRLMRCIGRVFSFLRINKTFQTQFVTTINGDVYFPETYREVVELINSSNWDKLKEKKYQSFTQSLLSRLFHEYVHISDSQRYPLGVVGFSFAYLTPQIYTVFALIPIIAAFLTSNYYYFAAVPFWSITVLPWASLSRCFIEARGYATNVVCLHMVYGRRVDQINPNAFMKNFLNSSYYWMAGHPKISPNRTKKKMTEMIRSHLNDAHQTLLNKEAGMFYNNLEHIYRICSDVKGG